MSLPITDIRKFYTHLNNTGVSVGCMKFAYCGRSIFFTKVLVLLYLYFLIVGHISQNVFILLCSMLFQWLVTAGQ